MKPNECLSKIAAVFTELQTFAGRSFRKSGHACLWQLEEVYVCIRFRRDKWSSEDEFLFLCDILICSRCVYEYRKNIDTKISHLDCHQYLSHISKTPYGGQKSWTILSESEVVDVVRDISSRFDFLVDTDFIRGILNDAGLVGGLLGESVWPNTPIHRVVDVGIMAIRTGNKLAAHTVLDRILQYDSQLLHGDPASKPVLDELKAYVLS